MCKMVADILQTEQIHIRLASIYWEQSHMCLHSLLILLGFFFLQSLEQLQFIIYLQQHISTET